jgi:hypothetical protein
MGPVATSIFHFLLGGERLEVWRHAATDVGGALAMPLPRAQFVLRGDHGRPSLDRSKHSQLCRCIEAALKLHLVGRPAVSWSSQARFPTFTPKA